MVRVGTFVLMIILLSAALMLLTWVVGACIALISWTLGLVFPLSMLEGIFITLVSGGVVLYVAYLFFRDFIMTDFLDDDEEEDEEEGEDDEPPIVPWRRRRPVPAPAPRKGKKRQ